jgi:nucleotide-binding universal stress UspA family protein
MNENRRSEQAMIVVVGVDGSPGAMEALRWAVAEARLRNSRLRIVHAWAFGFTGGPGSGYGYPTGTRGGLFTGAGSEQLRRASEELLDRMMTEIGAEAEGIEIEREVIEGGAAEVLVDSVSEGDLLVVGSRGHGGFAGLLLGSISHQCVHHAPCPVVVVHAPKPRSPLHADRDKLAQPDRP